MGGAPFLYLGGDAKLEMLVNNTVITSWSGPGGSSFTPIHMLKYIIDLQAKDWIYISAGITNDSSSPGGLPQRKLGGTVLSPVTSIIEFKLNIPSGTNNYCDIVKTNFSNAPINQSRVRMVAYFASQPQL